MDIVLRITQVNDKLLFQRNMFSDSGTGSSNIEGSFGDNQDGSAKAESIHGEYSITKEGYLKEYFPSNNRWNIYTKKDFCTKALEGNYSSK